MSRTVLVALALAGAGLLAGCASAPDAEPTVAAPASTPTPTATATPTPTPTASDELILPDCGDLFDDEVVDELMGPDMEGIGDISGPEFGGYGSSYEELQDYLDREGAVSCTWILTGSERSVSVSYRESAPKIEASVEKLLVANGATKTNRGAGYVLYELDRGGEFPATETHAIVDGVWVSVRDRFGENATALVEAALDTISDLNPTT